MVPSGLLNTKLIFFQVLIALDPDVAPIAPAVDGKGNRAVVAFAAVFSLVKGFHGKVLFFFNFSGFLGKQPGVAGLALEFLPQVKFMFKDNRPHRLNKNDRAAAVFLGRSAMDIGRQEEQH
jgi:hypothetical protein